MQSYRVGETNITALKLYLMSDLGFLQKMHIQAMVHHISRKSFIKDLPYYGKLIRLRLANLKSALQKYVLARNEMMNRLPLLPAEGVAEYAVIGKKKMIIKI